MHFNISDVFYSQCSYQRVPAGIPNFYQGDVVITRIQTYNLVHKGNLVHNLFLVYLSISTCFGRLCAHNQEKQLCLYDTWYLLFCVDNCLLWRVEFNPAYQEI
jgi:hypothetical protein